ncbi:hypothetical protein GOODEAATRI_003546 [Goodea atripinnis]|uniref:Uncharacterized protein n=1 Tax=Goodea atripinnis TaxID=208336 RepID=A0ABV0PUY8_9TELE
MFRPVLMHVFIVFSKGFYILTLRVTPNQQPLCQNQNNQVNAAPLPFFLQFHLVQKSCLCQYLQNCLP